MRAPARQLVIGLFIFFAAFALASVTVSDQDRRMVAFLGFVVEAGVLYLLWLNMGTGGGVAVQPLLSALRRASEGERPEPPPGTPPELVSVYDAIGDLAAAGRKKVAAERQRYQELLETQRGVETEVQRLDEALRGQTTAVDEAARAVREMSSGGGEAAKHVEQLASSAEESSSSILEITATNEEVAENTAELARSVRETVSSIEEMAYSIKEVAKNVEALSLTAEETSSSMNEMDVSIDQVQSNANETARLSEEVAHDAEKGAEAILKTIGEIYRIKESSQEAVSVIANLGSRIEAIGQIVGVIDEVAEQTNLLALNAAILAAQSGEHGKGFAVVADEIKDLAERAGGSTKEIADLVKTIQAESRNAINAVERSSHNVERGVEVSNEAERALKKILESSQKSTNMVRAIARATVEQAKGSKQVTDAIGRIAETVQQIAAATAQQARGSELIMKSAEKMRTITQHVERSSQEQARGSRQITQNIEGISNLVGLLTSAQKNVSRETGSALAASSRIEESLRTQGQALRHLSSSLEGLRRVTGDFASRGGGKGGGKSGNGKSSNGGKGAHGKSSVDDDIDGDDDELTPRVNRSERRRRRRVNRSEGYAGSASTAARSTVAARQPRRGRHEPRAPVGGGVGVSTAPARAVPPGRRVDKARPRPQVGTALEMPGHPHSAHTNGHALPGVVGFVLPENAARLAADPPAEGVAPSAEEGARFAPPGGGAGRFPPVGLTGAGGVAGSSGAGEGAEGGLEGLRLLGPVGTLAKAQEWLFVLRSVGLEGVVRPVYSGGWGVLVDEARHERALATLRTYEAENRDFPPVRRKDRPLYAPSWWALATFAALCAFFLVTGPASARSPFFRWGTADAELLLHGSPWRAVTALTLHADAQHALGNALGGTLFLSAVNRRLGPGLGTLTVLGAGTAGNVLNALWYGAGHRSIGASTAVFAAVGVLVAVQALLNQREARGWFATLGPVAGGLVLLGMLGANPNTDVRAHGFGFLAGVALGLPAALVARWRDRPVGSWGQAAFGLLSAGTVAGAWALAFGLRR